ncbi:PQQ-dependent sugar dehydrogenase [Novosphingobium sp. Gsoil 351]|uniref:PQQ-dependent sugar dehydrogenase n=1 Tax=Novosphingobium sp. Gsoil 351 TaxID=2675225 RepID=UPI0012B449BB|nr:PQQ-dependent sugar dehydrogenase [Novosphingobium sp. Gsoil 351]QGN53532.1 PQQ-dependent sugar dehydrogenase [Novosphingobium sp. Gsoil 351]
MKPLISTLAFALAAAPLASCNAAPARPDGGKAESNANFEIEEHGKFDEPWAMAFVPGTDVLFVTERGGTLKFLDTTNGTAGAVSGLPKVDYGGQGGLGDIAFLPTEATATLGKRTIYLTWVEAGEGGTRGAVAGRGSLLCDKPAACRIEGLSVIWRQDPKVTGRGHFSHRLLFAPDGQTLYLSSGERQKFTPAQDLTANLGKVLRLNPDGTAKPGNPFATKGGVSAQIWSYGHRNLLGLGFDAQGRLWDLEHGPAGGDEMNIIEPGKNYGWPVVSNGDNYDGTPIPRHATRPDLAAPAISWNPVIAPGDFIFYSGDKFPAWKGQALIAGMVYPGIVRVAIDGTKASEVERIELGNRIREIEQGPDGSVWIAEDGKGGRLRKLVPKG